MGRTIAFAAILTATGAFSTQGASQEHCLPGKHHTTAESRAECKGKPEKKAEAPKKRIIWELVGPFSIPQPAPPPKDAPSPGVDDYLCDVYYRLPVKIDSHGDYTWKDPAAATRVDLEICDYAIKGMDPDLREGLAAFGKKADGEGINWALLSGYRDEYRQRIAEGFKAGPCSSWHSGRTCGNRGYGRGRAADVWVADPRGRNADPNPLFRLVDEIGKMFGLTRPMRGYDPAHIQPSFDFRQRAAALRHNNDKIARQYRKGGNNRYAKMGAKVGSP